MRITGWHIDGFGMFAAHRVTDLPPGLTLIYGPNEAGKSTLLHFIRGVLFGFPDGRSKGKRYPALAGGRPGGRLFVEDDRGKSWTVERYSSPSELVVTGPGGTTAGPDDLGLLVGHVDRELFGNIFAFTLSELDSFEALEDRSVREKIFASTVSGAGRSPGEAMKELREAREKLLRPRGASEINDARGELKELRARLREARRAAGGYGEVLRAEQQAATLFAAADGRWEEAHGKLRRVRLLIDLWEDWAEIAGARSQVADLDVPAGVTEDCEGTLNELVTGISAATATFEENRKELERLSDRHGRVVVDDRMASVAAEVFRAHGDLSGYELQLEQVAEARRAALAARSAVDQLLIELGPGWDMSRVADFDRSIPAREAVREWAGRMGDAARDVEESRRELDQIGREWSGATAALDARERELAEFTEEEGDIRGSDELDNRDRLARQLRARLADLAAVEAKVQATQATWEDRQAAEAAGRRSAPGGVPRMLVAIAALLALVAVAEVALHTWAAAVVLGVAAAVLAVAAARLSAGPPGDPAGDSPVERARRAYQEHLDRRGTIKSEIASLAGSLGLREVPTADDVEEVLARGEEARRVGRTMLSLKKEADGARELVSDIGRRREEAAERLARAAGEQDRLAADWDRWRAGHGLPEGGSPEVVEDVFDAVGRARDALEVLRRSEGKQEDLERQVGEYLSAVERVFSGAGVAFDPSTDSLRGVLTSLRERVDADAKARLDRERLAVAISGAEKDLAEASARRDELVEALSTLLATAGVTTEAALRDALKRLRRQEELATLERNAMVRIEKRIGTGPEAERLLDEVRMGDRTGWEAERDRLVIETELLKAERDDALEARNSTARERRSVEESSDISSLEIEAQALHARIGEAFARWQEIALAEALVEETVGRFEAKHQPAVVARAGELFSAATAGAYTSLRAGEQELAVCNASSTMVDVADLSTGAAQQLYLCVRVGLAEEFARRGASLPFVMDEVLVSFDPERAGAIARMIAGVSQQRQVIMLSCHPEAVERMREACPEARVVTLERYAGGAVHFSGGAS